MPIAAGRIVRRKRVLTRLVATLITAPFIALLGSFALHEALLSVGRTAHAVTEVEIAGRRVDIWKPAGVLPTEGYPVVLFSPGFASCGRQSVALTEGLSHAGYLVLAPDHRDAACGPSREGRHFEKLSSVWSQKPFLRPESWSDATYRDRRDDLEAILDAVLKQKSFQGIRVDPNRVGLAGHSLGGYTVLGLAGAWPSWKDARVKAVLALSPYCTPYIRKGTLGGLGVPVMYQGGTLDIGVTPFVRRRGGAYDQTSSPKYYIEFGGASHLAWTNLSKSYQPVFLDYALAFFDRYLRGAEDPLVRLLDRPWPKYVSDIRYSMN